MARRSFMFLPGEAVPVAANPGTMPELYRGPRNLGLSEYVDR